MNVTKKTKVIIGVLIVIVVYAIALFVAYGDRQTPEERLDAFMENKYAQECNVAPSMSILVVDEGEVVYEKSFGYADVEAKVKATTATNYRLASDSKMFTAMAIMILKDRGLLDYDTKVCDILEDFPAYGKDITVKQLINHTSGLYDFYDYTYLLGRHVDTEHQVLDSDVYEIVKKLDSTEFTPGTEFHYVDTGYILLGLIVEKVSGQTLTDFMAEKIFDPLEMNNSLMCDRTLNQDIKNRAYGALLYGDKYITKDQNYSSATRGDGGVYSSLEDLYKWDMALYTDKLVSEETLKEAYIAEGLVNPIDGSQYNFGWCFKETENGEIIMNHFGSSQGFATAHYRNPDHKRTIIVLSNKNNDDSAYDMLGVICDIYGFDRWYE